MRRRVLIIRHSNDPPDDRVYTYLDQHGFEPVVCKPFLGDRLDDPDETLAGTVIHGGGFNACAIKQHPFLREEYRWIDACLKASVPMLGICQGAQQIALHLGADVGPKPGQPHEFGYYRVDPTNDGRHFLPSSLWMTQAHYHTFSVPSGAVHLASSELFEHQAFRYGQHVYGCQFHPEVTIEGFRRWQRATWASDFNGPGAQPIAEQNTLMLAHDQRQADWFYEFLSGLFAPVSVE